MIVIPILRVVLDLILAFITVYAYNFGADLIISITQWDNFAVQLVGGATFGAAVFHLLSKVKEFLFFYLKCCVIYNCCHPKTTGLLQLLRAVTCEWKETFSIPIVNKAVRGVLKQINDTVRLPIEQVPDVFSKMANTSIVRCGVHVAEKVFDYADECVLEWCYAHDDSLLNECISGITIFVKHSPVIITRIIPTVILQYVIRIGAVLGCVIYYVGFIGISLTTVIPAYIIILCVDKILQDAILEPMFMNHVLHVFSKYLGENGPTVESMKTAIADAVDLNELSALVRRFTDGDEDADTGRDSEDTDTIE